jgi:hypothetical protein
MRTVVLVIVALLIAGAAAAPAQFKTQAQEESRVSQGMIQQPSSSWLFGWFDPSKFTMRHSLEMSYMTMGGGQGFSLGTYTNSMQYEFSDKLNARADISLSYSPFNSFSAGLGGKRNDLSALYLSRAEINYQPWENTRLQLSFRQLPYGYYATPFSNPWYREGGF